MRWPRPGSRAELALVVVLAAIVAVVAIAAGMILDGFR